MRSAKFELSDKGKRALGEYVDTKRSGGRVFGVVAAPVPVYMMTRPSTASKVAGAAALLGLIRAFAKNESTLARIEEELKAAGPGKSTFSVRIPPIGSRSFFKINYANPLNRGNLGTSKSLHPFSDILYEKQAPAFTAASAVLGEMPTSVIARNAVAGSVLGGMFGARHLLKHRKSDKLKSIGGILTGIVLGGLAGASALPLYRVGKLAKEKSIKGVLNELIDAIERDARSKRNEAWEREWDNFYGQWQEEARRRNWQGGGPRGFGRVIKSFDELLSEAGFEKSLTKAGLRSQFIAKAKKLHPDVNPGKNTENEMKDLNDLWDRISKHSDFNKLARLHFS